MSRIPKWLLQKEWLTYGDVVKLMESAGGSLEEVLAIDHSVELQYSYRFQCTFCPRLCGQQFKEYRREAVARQAMRAHLKEHINNFADSMSQEDQADFLTRNQMCRVKKTGSKAPVKNEVWLKQARGTKRRSPDSSSSSSESGSAVSESKKLKGQEKRCKSFTRLKGLPLAVEDKDSTDLKEDGNGGTLPLQALHLEKANQNSFNNIVFEELKIEIPEIKTEIVDSSQDDVSTDSGSSLEGGATFRRSSETQTENNGKEEETLPYKVATKLFAADRALWNNVEKTLADILAKDFPGETLVEEDKRKTLAGMEQWIESCRICDTETVSSRKSEPLTDWDRKTLNDLTPEKWKILTDAQDSESKIRLTVYAGLLLRDYESHPRKLKPKFCRHCNKTYTASTSLHSHLTSLAGIRVWVCSRCRAAKKEDCTFTRKHSLQYHIMKEVGIPRYRCGQPGCNKTHNHTHHQQSHARQHSGEKKYGCQVEGCSSSFSNRNTYSRHLLQVHCFELQRNNQLQEIDPKIAQMKVHAARLKARERSKSKRQLGSDGVVKSVGGKKQGVSPVGVGIQVPVTEELTALEEIPAPKSTDNSAEDLALDKKPTASQLIMGIAREFRNNTCTQEEPKTGSNPMTNLDLLANVSKYMNSVDLNDGQEDGHSAVPEPSDSNVLKENCQQVQCALSDPSSQQDGIQRGEGHMVVGRCAKIVPQPPAVEAKDVLAARPENKVFESTEWDSSSKKHASKKSVKRHCVAEAVAVSNGPVCYDGGQEVFPPVSCGWENKSARAVLHAVSLPSKYGMPSSAATVIVTTSDGSVLDSRGSSLPQVPPLSSGTSSAPVSAPSSHSCGQQTPHLPAPPTEHTAARGKPSMSRLCYTAAAKPLPGRILTDSSPSVSVSILTDSSQGLPASILTDSCGRVPVSIVPDSCGRVPVSIVPDSCGRVPVSSSVQAPGVAMLSVGKQSSSLIVTSRNSSEGKTFLILGSSKQNVSLDSVDQTEELSCVETGKDTRVLPFADL